MLLDEFVLDPIRPPLCEVRSLKNSRLQSALPRRSAGRGRCAAARVLLGLQSMCTPLEARLGFNQRPRIKRVADEGFFQ